MPGLAKALENASSAAARKAEGGGSADASIPGEGERDAEVENENEKQREEARAKKNVNRSLQRLKEQIKAEKLRKRLEVRAFSRESCLHRRAESLPRL